MGTCYSFDGNEVWGDLDSAGTFNWYIRGPGTAPLLARVERPGGVAANQVAYRFIADRQGSVMSALDAQGAPVGRILYGSFGTQAYGYGLGKLGWYRYLAKEWDAEIGVMRSSGPDYMPEMGRYISQAPLGFGGELNQYRFEGNNPTNVSTWTLRNERAWQAWLAATAEPIRLVPRKTPWWHSALYELSGQGMRDRVIGGAVAGVQQVVHNVNLVREGDFEGLFRSQTAFAGGLVIEAFEANQLILGPAALVFLYTTPAGSHFRNSVLPQGREYFRSFDAASYERGVRAEPAASAAVDAGIMVGTLGLGTPAVAARTAATQGTRSLLSMTRVLGAMRGVPAALSKAGKGILSTAGKVVSRGATIVRETAAFVSRTGQVLRQAPAAIRESARSVFSRTASSVQNLPRNSSAFAQTSNLWYHRLDRWLPDWIKSPVQFLTRLFRLDGGVEAFASSMRGRGLHVTIEDAVRSSRQVGDRMWLRRAAPRREWLEEFVHSIQSPRQIDAVEAWVRARGIDPFHTRATAREIHAKMFMLRHADTMGLSWWDRTFLRAGLRRLQRTGFSGAY